MVWGRNNLKLDAKCYRGQQATNRWPAVQPLLQPAIDRFGQLDAATIVEGLAASRFQLWLDPAREGEMAAVTGISQYPAMRALYILIVGGKRIASWQSDLVATLTEFARANDCRALEACVRPGMVGATFREPRSILKGWNKVGVLVRKPV